jgi:hypothetical protein
MNEFLRNFIMKTIRKMVNNVPEWQVREYAIGWYSKGVLTDADLQEIDDMYKPLENTEPISEENSEVAEVDSTEQIENTEEEAE